MIVGYQKQGITCMEFVSSKRMMQYWKYVFHSRINRCLLNHQSLVFKQNYQNTKPIFMTFITNRYFFPELRGNLYYLYWYSFK